MPSRCWRVAGTRRSPRRNPADIADIAATGDGRCLPLTLDVTDGRQIGEAVARAEARFGAIDVLVNNAGYGYRTAVEEATDEGIRAQFETNFFGLVALTQKVLPAMRKRRSGTIINISSAGGRTVLPGSAFYSGSKFAVEGFSDALRKEVEPLGIRVLLVEPGPFRTDFAGRSLRQSAEPMAEYANTSGLRRRENSGAHGTQPGDPVRAARIIIETLEADKPPFRLVLGRTAADRIEAELESQLRELRAWRQKAIDADYPTAG